MIRYYSGRMLQIAGMVIMAETLIVYFGQMMPLLKGSLVGVCLFYVGYFLLRKHSVGGDE